MNLAFFEGTKLEIGQLARLMLDKCSFVNVIIGFMGNLKVNFEICFKKCPELEFEKHPEGKLGWAEGKKIILLLKIP